MSYTGELRLEKRLLSPSAKLDQITIGTRVGALNSAMPVLSDFYWIPDSNMIEKLVLTPSSSTSDYVFELGKSGDSSSSLPTKIKVAGLGDIREVRVEHTSGQLLSERIYSAFTEFSGGVRLPRIAFHCIYRNSVLETVAMSAIDQAEFNLPLDDALFEATIKKGDVVVDNRGETVRVESANVDTTAKRIIPPLDHNPIALNSSNTRFWSFIFALNVCVVLLLAAIVAYRKLFRRNSLVQ